MIFWEPGKKAVHQACNTSPLPKITIEEDGDWLTLSFPYDERLVALVKSLPVRKYDSTFKTWLVPNTESTRRSLEAGGAEIKEESSVGAIELKKTLTVSDKTTHEDYPFLFKHQAQVVNTALSGKTKLYLGMPPGTGKAQPLTSNVLVPGGWKQMGDIEVGDKVMTPDGGTANVVGVFPQGDQPVYKITLSDGSVTRATGEHLWRAKSVAGSRGKWRTVTTDEMISTGLYRPSSGACKWRLPHPTVDRDAVDLPIHPYVIGALLGDGALTGGTPSFASADWECVQRVGDLIKDLNVHPVLVPGDESAKCRSYSLSKISDTSSVCCIKGCERRRYARMMCSRHYDRARYRGDMNTDSPLLYGRTNLLTHRLRQLGIMGLRGDAKFVPESYMHASYEQRLELLKGLMDTDGSWSSGSGDFASKSFQLATDVANLVRSLGGYASCRKGKSSWTVNGVKKFGVVYRTFFNIPVNPFYMNRKRELWADNGQNQRRVKFIEPDGVEEVQCILLDSEDHLYITDDYIVTHNTNASAASMDALDAYPLLVVTLAGIKVNIAREVKKFYGKDSQILESRTPYEITEDIVIINYDILDAWADTLKKHKFKGIIFDESASIKSPDAKRTKAAVKIAKGVKNIMLLSGTPTPSSPYDLVPPLMILGEIEKYGGKREYVNRYCPPVETRYGVSHSQYQNLPELHSNLKKTCFISWKKEDLIDLPAINIYDEVVDGKSDYMDSLIKSMEAATISEAYRVLREDKDDQVGQFATMRSEAGESKIKSIIEEATAVAEDEKVIVGVHHRSVNDEVFKSLSKKFKTVQIIGGMGTEKRQEAIDAFQEGDARVLVMNIVAGGVGINLQNASHMILGELPVSYADQDQVVSRIYRSGQRNKVSVKRMVALGTIDDVLVHLIDKKRNLHTSIMAGEESVNSDIMEEMAKYLVERKERTL